MSYSTLLLHEENGIATITFNRPEKRNAISYELIHEFLAALKVLEKSAAQIVVVTGSGKSFCSGLDLDNLRNLIGRSPEQSLQDSQTIAELFRTLYEFPKVTIAAVNGPAIAGGCGIATLCDFTIASSEAKFGYSEVRIGFIPAIVASFLVRQIGEKEARELLLTGKIISAEEAWSFGLVNKITAPHELLDNVYKLARELMENSPASLAATKRLLNSFSKADLDREIDAALRANADIRSTEDFREGVTSFLEKRKPKWTNR